VVGLVIVSHSAKLAEGVVELARQMGGEDVAIEAAGGMADPPGEIGTDMALVLAAIEAAASDDGVIVLMDLGSAVMSAEMAAEMVKGTEVVLCEAPLATTRKSYWRRSLRVSIVRETVSMERTSSLRTVTFFCLRRICRSGAAMSGAASAAVATW